jgi:hypothetical protein
MGVGVSAAAKVEELQGLERKEALRRLGLAGVEPKHAKTVLKRICELGDGVLDLGAVLCLVEGLPAATQDALALLATGATSPAAVGPSAPRGAATAAAAASTPSSVGGWEETQERLLGADWEVPTSLHDDGPSLIGLRVYVEGHGSGSVLSFVRARLGPSSHEVTFDAQVAGASAATRTVKLRRKGNSELRWLLRGGRGRRRGTSTQPEPEPEPEPATSGGGGGGGRPATPPWARAFKGHRQPQGSSRSSSRRSSSPPRQPTHAGVGKVAGRYATVLSPGGKSDGGSGGGGDGDGWAPSARARPHPRRAAAGGPLIALALHQPSVFGGGGGGGGSLRPSTVSTEFSDAVVSQASAGSGSYVRMDATFDSVPSEWSIADDASGQGGVQGSIVAQAAAAGDWEPEEVRLEIDYHLEGEGGEGGAPLGLRSGEGGRWDLRLPSPRYGDGDGDSQFHGGAEESSGGGSLPSFLHGRIDGAGRSAPRAAQAQAGPRPALARCAPERRGGGGGGARLEAEAARAARAGAVSRSCACIGSPCLRQCVHGASIAGRPRGGGGAEGRGRRAGADAVEARGGARLGVVRPGVTP